MEIGENKYMPGENRIDDLITPTKDTQLTDYGRGLEPKKDNITEYGKGLSYLTCDGHKCATMEEVMQYNQMYYEMMKNNINNDYIENKGMHR